MITEPKYTLAQDVLFVESNDEMAIYHSKRNEYYALEQVGSFIFNQLSTPKSLSEIKELVNEHFDTENCDLDLDIPEFIKDLEDNKLILSV